MVFFKRWFRRPEKELDKETGIEADKESGTESGNEDMPLAVDTEFDSAPESPESPPESAEEAAPEQKTDSVPESAPESILDSAPESAEEDAPESAPESAEEATPAPKEDSEEETLEEEATAAPKGNIEEEAPSEEIPTEEAPSEEIPTEAPPTEDDSEEDASEDIGWFSRLRQGLGKSTARITSGLASVIGKPKLDMADLTDIEDALIMADLGTEAAARLARGLKGRTYPDGVNRDTLAAALADELTTILAPVEKPLEVSGVHKPHVILMVGVNGSGKTTTAGKLAEFFRLNGLSVILAAADTFRAAATEQLQIWGERTGTTVITGGNRGGGGGDAAAVAYQALEEAAATGVDVVIIDTAGRLQTRAELMDELAKIHRVIGKRDAAAPHDSIIVLDGTVGQNALAQVEAFRPVAGLTGMIITKLDGTARGGIVVALAQKYGLPVHAVGVGEQKEDLQPFEAAAFASALAGVDAPSPEKPPSP